MEKEPFGNPETDTPLCIADGESLWCSVVLPGFSVVVTGPGSGYTTNKHNSQQTGYSQANRIQPAKLKKLLTRSPFIFAVAFRAFLVKQFIKSATKCPMRLLCASTEQRMLENR